MSTAALVDRPHRITALKALYIYTIVGAGLFGAWTLLAPASMLAAFAMPAADPYLLGISGAVDAGFGIVAAIGLRAPGKFAPVFLLQLVYKTLWLLLAFVPHAVHGAPGYAWMIAAVFASYVALDIIALPFAALLRRE